MRLRRFLGALLVVALLGGAAFGALWGGLVPARLDPFQPLDLAEPDPWFRDFRLARLKRDTQGCRQVLSRPHVEATPIEDRGIENGCGWRNAYRVASAGGARLGVDRLTCETTAAFALWMAHVVQPLAQEILGARVAAVQTVGTYACRNIVGDRGSQDVRSEHARANAIDVAGFTLTDGRQISVARHWSNGAANARFLRAAHRGACRYFRVTLGPDYNAAHKDHFHLDRGWMRTCE
jgi:hypothetical protein